MKKKNIFIVIFCIIVLLIILKLFLKTSDTTDFNDTNDAKEYNNYVFDRDSLEYVVYDADGNEAYRLDNEREAQEVIKNSSYIPYMIVEDYTVEDNIEN